MIIDALHASSRNEQAFSIPSIRDAKECNTLQQRIRNEAKKLNYKVMIHFNKDEGALYFKVSPRTEELNTFTYSENQ